MEDEIQGYVPNDIVGSSSPSEDEEKIYPVIDALKSPQTKKSYRLAFNHFLNTTPVKNQDLMALLNCKPSVIKSRIIDYVEHLKDVQKLSYSTIQVRCAAKFH